MKRLFAISLLVTLSIMFQGMYQTQAGSGECVQYDDVYTLRHQINLTTGEETGDNITAAVSHAVQVSRESPIIATSPNKQHTVIQYQTDDSKVVFGLLPAYTANALLEVNTPANDGFYHDEITWSPDSRWFSYISYRSDDAYYLTFADASGQVVYDQLISTRLEDWINSFGWSADGRYLALSVSDSVGGPLRKIEIWSTPDFGLKKVIKPQNSVDSPRGWAEPGDADRIQWSPTGSKLAYIHHLETGMDDLFSLNMYTPDDDQTLTFDLPYLANTGRTAGIAMSWSPDGKFAAIITTFYTNDRIGRISVYGTDGSANDTVSDKAAAEGILSDGGIGFPLYDWSADGHAVLFVEDVTGKSQYRGKLMAYLPDAQKRVEVYPAIYLNPHMVAGGRFMIARSPLAADGSQNSDAADNSQDSLVVIDTNSFDVLRLSAANAYPNAAQVYGILDQSPWLLLEEDTILTWAVNLDTGTSVALYEPDVKGSDQAAFQRVVPLDGERVVWLTDVDSDGLKIAILSLDDHSIQPIAYTFDKLPGAIAASARGDKVAMLTAGDKTQLTIVSKDGEILGQWTFDAVGKIFHFVFAKCDG
ncbi:MAG: hypothetical protein R3E39_20085 [Anaerolineae bacterium]